MVRTRKLPTKPDEPSGYAPPTNPEAEQSVLGAILVRPEVLDRVLDIIAPVDFYREAHGRIFRAMLDLYAKNEPVDLVTVTALLKERNQLEGVGGPVFLSSLSEQVGFAVNADYYAGIVRDKAILRRTLDATQEIAGACFASVENLPEFLDQAEARFLGAISREKNDTQMESLGHIAQDDYRRMESLFNQGMEAHGLPAGFYDYDRLTVGFHPGELTILAARPSMGKTALALNIAWNLGGKGMQPTAVFSLEMPKYQLQRRFVSSIAEIDGERLRRCRLNANEWAARERVQGLLDDAPIWIDDKVGISALELRARCRRLKSRYGLAFIVVDYLQLMREPVNRNRSRAEGVGANSKALKELAGELKVPILALCQVNREIEKEKRKYYRLADLKESGDIEQDADNVLFLWRDKEAVVAELELAKQRNGRLGKFKLTFRPEFTRFESYAAE